VVRSILDGRLEEAVANAEQMVDYGRDVALPDYARILAGLANQRALFHLGRYDEATREVSTAPARVLAKAYLGQVAEVTAHLDEFVIAWAGSTAFGGCTSTATRTVVHAHSSATHDGRGHRVASRSPAAEPEVLATARAQRWDPAEVLKVLLGEEVAGRERSGLATRRVEAAFSTGKTFATWDQGL
jgi:hypothetical protein